MLDLAAVGTGLSVDLISLSALLATGRDRIVTIATDISFASGVIQQLANLLRDTSTATESAKKRNIRNSILNSRGLELTISALSRCRETFSEIRHELDKANRQLRERAIYQSTGISPLTSLSKQKRAKAQKQRKDGKITLTKAEKAKWPFLQPQISALGDELEVMVTKLHFMLGIGKLYVVTENPRFDASL